MGYFYNDSNGIITSLGAFKYRDVSGWVLHVGVGFWQTHGF
jgi:hypothetical protein